MALLKKLPKQWWKLLSSKCAFLPLVLSKKSKTKYHGIFIPFKREAYSKHGSIIFLLFGSWSLILYLCVWVKTKFFSDNFKLTNLVDVQRLHQNGELIICVSNGVYIFPFFSTLVYQNFSFTANLRYLRFSIVQKFLSHLSRIRSRWFVFIWSRKSFVPFKSFTTYS